jgi:hypothetical protein
MPLTRNSDQASETLEQFYAGFAARGNEYPALSQAMLAFVDMVNRSFVETPLWGLTSLARLVIQAEDDWKSPWYIIVVSSVTPGHYLFEYLMPENQAPWPQATVHGTASSLEEAKRYLLIAMHRCGGWADNHELEQLLAADTPG